MRGDPISEEEVTRRADLAPDRDMQAYIGSKLQGIYDEIAHEAVPDRFLQLLAQLERREARQP
jgi:hypothetical protein